MKKTLKLVPALAMLLVSAILVSTSTYAWFSMSNTVTATGMKVMAQAESGIVIRNALTSGSPASEAYNAWAISSPAQHTAPVVLIPTSTENCTNWYHATSANFDNADAHQDTANYTTVETIANGTRVDNYTNPYYACYKYYIKVSSKTELTVASLDVNSITVTFPASQQSPELNKALRVGIVADPGNTKTGTFVKIYAPVSGATTNYYVDNNTTAMTALTSTEVAHCTAVTTIPVADGQLAVYVYIWFEGEDAACKSSNITATLDNLEVAVQFGYTVPTP